MVSIKGVICVTLVDKDIHALIQSRTLLNADDGHVGAVSYDLRTMYYAQGDGEYKDAFELAPHESVFVACEEIIHMPVNMIGRIILRNSRIRAGLMLDAPVYQPGHHTRIFFRITNVSEQPMKLTKDAEFASIMFERLDHAPDQPYQGEFQQELDFKNLGAYHKRYKAELQEYEDKAENLHNMEKSIYANVITLLSVFVALFSLINVNIELAYAETVEVARMLVFNLTTVGSIAFLVALIRSSISRKKPEFWLLLLLAAVMFIAAIKIAV